MTEAFYVPHGPAHDRVVSFVVDVTVHNAGPRARRVRVFPWALLIGQRFYGEPEKQVRANAGERFIRSYGEESGWVRWWGGSRTPGAVVVALREQTLLQGMTERHAGRRRAPGRDHPAPGRVRLQPHLRRVRVPAGGRAGRARVAAHRGRLPQGRRRQVQAGARAAAAGRGRAARHRALLRRAARRRALPHAFGGDQPRRGVGQDQHAAGDQGVPAGLGLDQLAALRHPGLARHVVVRARLRLLLALVLARRDRAVQPLPRAQRPGGGVRARRQRLQDLLRPQRQRRHAAARHRDPAPLQRHPRRRLAARGLPAGGADRRLHALAARRRTGCCSARPAGSTCSASPRGATSSPTTRSTAR